jgi:hypothetical protein
MQESTMSIATIRLPATPKLRRDDFNATAERRYAEIMASGETIPWNEMRRYLDERRAGIKATRPSVKETSPLRK